jgi:hypothetical protein
MPTTEQAKALIAARVSPWELVGDPWLQADEWHAYYSLSPWGPLIHAAFKISSWES